MEVMGADLHKEAWARFIVHAMLEEPQRGQTYTIDIGKVKVVRPTQLT